MTKDEWIDVVLENKKDFIGVVTRWNPSELGDFKTAMDNRNLNECNRILNEAWWRAPDQPGLHEMPGWNSMCDILSDLPEDYDDEEDEVGSEIL